MFDVSTVTFLHLVCTVTSSSAMVFIPEGIQYIAKTFDLFTWASKCFFHKDGHFKLDTDKPRFLAIHGFLFSLSVCLLYLSLLSVLYVCPFLALNKKLPYLFSLTVSFREIVSEII
jgi:hypothetical protein